ncbi:MAG: GNAT family N-acetyltransferase [Mycobacteriales bacterium]
MLIEIAAEDDVSDLAVLLVDAVAGGACLGFLAGVRLEEAENFWRESLRDADTWVARLAKAGPAVGVVQLHPARLPNGQHRAEIAKLIVHRSARHGGVARQLMRTAEQAASWQGRWLARPSRRHRGKAGGCCSSTLRPAAQPSSCTRDQGGRFLV